MRKLVFMLVALSGVWFVSCQNDSTSPSPMEESATMASDLESLVTSAARNAVLTDSVTMGKCKGKLTEVATTELTASITDYISATYVGSEIKYAAKDESGKVIIAITLADGTLKGLLFNADGSFKQELKQHVKKAKLTKVEITTLPATVTDYITATFASAELKQAATNADGEYFVGILVDAKIKVLLFNADGTFNKELEQPIKRHKRH